MSKNIRTNIAIIIVCQSSDSIWPVSQPPPADVNMTFLQKYSIANGETLASFHEQWTAITEHYDMDTDIYTCINGFLYFIEKQYVFVVWYMSSSCLTVVMKYNMKCSGMPFIMSDLFFVHTIMTKAHTNTFIQGCFERLTKYQTTLFKTASLCFVPCCLND